MKTLSKKILAVILAVVMVFALASCVTVETGGNQSGGSKEAEAANETKGKSRLDQIKAAGKMTVATEPYFAPQEFIDPSKEGQEQYVGADIEFAHLIADKIGVEVEIVPLEFTAVVPSVSEGKYDIAISALAWTPERAEALELSKGYYFSKTTTGYGLLIRTEMADQIKNAEDCADYIVITQSGSLQEAMVNDQVPSYKEFKRVSSMQDAFLAVQEGKADAAAVSIPNAQLYIDNNPDCGMMIAPDFKFDMNEEYLGTRCGVQKGDTEFMDLVNEVIDEMLESGIYEKWYDEYSAYAGTLGI